MQTAFVIGLGRVGRNHAEAYRDDEGFRLVGVAEVDDERRARVSDAVGLPTPNRYTDHETGLAATEPDVVSVATPAAFHTDHVTDALAHDPRVVWCEKPLATSVRDGERLVRRADEAGVELVVNHARRFSETFETVAEWLHEGRVVGRVQSVRITTGVELLNLGTHYVDLVLSLLDTRAVRVASASLTRTDDGERFVGGGVIETESGVTAEIARERRPTHRLEIEGSDGRLSVPLAVGPDVTPTVELWRADAPGRVTVSDSTSSDTDSASGETDRPSSETESADGTEDDGSDRVIDPAALTETWEREATRLPDTYEPGFVPAQPLFENGVRHVGRLSDGAANAAPGRRAVHGLAVLTALVVASETGTSVDLPLAAPFRETPLALDPADPVRFDPTD
ncbi:MAG: Gfo/Idh/MocA family protein [Halobaculum sp.]